MVDYQEVRLGLGRRLYGPQAGVHRDGRAAHFAALPRELDAVVRNVVKGRDAKRLVEPLYYARQFHVRIIA